MTRKPGTTPAAIVADICLYGGTHGAGWLVRTADGRMLGDGNPREGVTLTQAVWTAIGALSAEFGIKSGTVHVFEPSGRRMAETRIERPKTIGDMTWTPAPVYTINAADLEAAATEIVTLNKGAK